MSTTKGQETKKKIVRSATRLIHTRGYKNTSLDDVFADSGVNKGSFYFHFTGKDELVHAVIDRFLTGIERRLDLISETNGPALEKVSIYFGGMASMFEQSGCTGGCLLGNLTLEVSDWHEGLRDHLSICFDRMKGRLTEFIVEGQRSGEVRTDRSAEELAAFLIALMEGALMAARLKKDAAAFRDLTKDALDFLKVGALQA
jgi:TetR/AcrR family transcriptional repressor of nem operon